MSYLSLTKDTPINKFEILKVFLLLCTSGITFFSGSEALLMLTFAINLGIFVYNKEKIDNGAIIYFVFCIFLSVGQILWLKDGSLMTHLGVIIRFGCAYLVLKNCKNFIHSFLTLMLFFAIVAIIFYGFFVMFPSIETMLFNSKSPWDDPKFYALDKSLIIYNIHYEPLYGVDSLGLFGLPRNSGPFWEPGAFGGYLNVAIVMQVLFYRKFNWKVGVFLIALFTTFSTTAYMATGIFFLLYSLFVNNQGGKIIILLPIIAGVVWFAVFNVEFLADKIESQFKEFSEGNIYANQAENDTRIGSASLDFKDLQRSPVFGTGSSDETRWGPGEKLFFRSNGLTDYLVRVGIAGFVFCFLFLANSCKNLFRRLDSDKAVPSGWILAFMIFFVSMGEAFLIMPFFQGMYFLQYLNIPEIEEETETDFTPTLEQ